MHAFLDNALDRLVVPGYTTAGYALRSRSWAEIPAAALAGRDVLITGASSGIGAAAATGAARAGATVHLLVRDEQRGEKARQQIADAAAVGPGERLPLWTCDVSDLDDVRRFAAAFAADVPALSGLVHNAGVMTDSRQRSAQGHELTFATHVLGPFLLTKLLAEQLRAGAPATVVFVSSGGMYTARLEADDLELERRNFDGPGFYAHAKRIQVILAEELAADAGGSGVAYAAMHPGWADTPGLRRSLPRFRRLVGPLLRSPEQGADTVVWLLAGSAATTSPGAFWHDRRPRPTHLLPRTRETAAERGRLIDALEAMTAAHREPLAAAKGA
jgi:NAD(P)-dependent dehydrogenase (short-subunit alcohol dehydrogenase family)